jgi:hypothetical protein
VPHDAPSRSRATSTTKSACRALTTRVRAVAVMESVRGAAPPGLKPVPASAWRQRTLVRSVGSPTASALAPSAGDVRGPTVSRA